MGMQSHTARTSGQRKECVHVKAITETVPVTVATIVNTMKVVAPKKSSAMPEAASTPHAARPRSPAMHIAKHSKVLSTHMHRDTAVIVACMQQQLHLATFIHPC